MKVSGVKLVLLVAVMAVAGCASRFDLAGEGAFCTPVQRPTLTSACGLGKPPSAYYSAPDRTLYVLAWKRLEEVLAALHGKMIGPAAVTIRVRNQLIQARLAPMRGGPTETDEGFILPDEPVKKWDETKPPQYGDVLVWLDHECTTASLELDCFQSQFKAQLGGPWQNGWLKWANGLKEKSYGGCAPKPGKICSTVWTDAGDVDAYGDAKCTSRIATFAMGLWVCLEI